MNEYGAATAEFIGQEDTYICDHCTKDNDGLITRNVVNLYKHAEGSVEVVCDVCKRTISLIMTL